MSDEMVQKGFRITGRVQGVGFRWWARRTAEQLFVSGTVRNLADGSVEVHARAGAGTLERFRRKLREGPRTARVAEVQEIDSSSELPAGFEIRR